MLGNGSGSSLEARKAKELWFRGRVPRLGSSSNSNEIVWMDYAFVVENVRTFVCVLCI
jgi:hypothetical protein